MLARLAGAVEATATCAVDAAQALWIGGTAPQTGDVLFVGGTRNGGVRLSGAELAATAKPASARRVVCISDIHEYHDALRLPPADILIVAGDVLLLNRMHTLAAGRRKIEAFREWCWRQPVADVLLVAGNHDHVLAAIGEDEARALVEGHGVDDAGTPNRPIIRYLVDNAVTVQGLRVYGSPLSFGRSTNNAFQDQTRRRDNAPPLLPDAPVGLDVLITHHPGRGRLEPLLHRTRPRLHVGGHVHSAYGARALGETLSVTACIMDSKYKPVNLPIVVDL